MPKAPTNGRWASAAVRTARELDRGEFVTECSALGVALWRAANPLATDRQRDAAVSTAVQDAEQLYRVLVNRGHRT